MMRLRLRPRPPRAILHHSSSPHHPSSNLVSFSLPNIAHSTHHVVLWWAGLSLPRYERGEETHHVNGDKTDNRPINLLVLSKVDHSRVHNLAWRLMQAVKSVPPFLPARCGL